MQTVHSLTKYETPLPTSPRCGERLLNCFLYDKKVQLLAVLSISVKANKKFTYSKLSSNLEQEPHPQPPHRLRGGGWDVPYMTGNRCK